jgi:SAM-dependent methyltransferase
MSDIERWNARFASDDYVFGTEPNAFLRAQAHRLRAGMTALSVADGEGRNGVWLAGQGLSVTAVEGSPVAIAKARRLAATRGVSLDVVEADLTTWSWPQASFDVVVAIFIQFVGPPLRDRIFAGMVEALKPGGLLLLQGYRPEQIANGTGGPRMVENLYTEGQLRRDFAGLVIEELVSHDSILHEGAGHDGMSAVIDLVARRPS